MYMHFHGTEHILPGGSHCPVLCGHISDSIQLNTVYVFIHVYTIEIFSLVACNWIKYLNMHSISYVMFNLCIFMCT